MKPSAVIVRSLRASACPRVPRGARWAGRGLLAAALVLLLSAAAIAQDEPVDHAAVLLRQVEAALSSGSGPEFMALTATDADRDSLEEFTGRWFSAATTRAVVQERDRTSLPDGGYRLLVDALVEAGGQGQLATWRLDVGPGTNGWRLREAATVSVVDGLLRLSLDPAQQYRARDLVVRAEDLELRLREGSVFVAEAGGGITAAVLLGRGEMTFSPAPETERHQIRLFAGDPVLRTSFDAALVRFSPGAARTRLPAEALTPVKVDGRRLERAAALFEEEVGKAFAIDLGDMSRDTWSLPPPPGDFLAEVHTRRYGPLTYAHSSANPEDVALFDRAQRKNISIYPSRARLEARGRFYDEDEEAEFDVLNHQVDVRFSPSRFWFDGRAQMRLRVRAYALGALTIRLADSLVVASVRSETHGRLLSIRVRGQNSLIVNLPEPASRGDEITLAIQYAGRLEPQTLDRENLYPGGQSQVIERFVFPAEPSYVYSSRSYWYPQNGTSDYATALIRFTVPDEYDVACSGAPVSGSPVTLHGDDAVRRLFVFSANRPLRYLGCVVSRLVHEESRELNVPAGAPDGAPSALPSDRARIRLMTTPRVSSAAREAMREAGRIVTFYTELLGELPYPELTLAAVESQIPGGHSPGYLIVLNQPLPGTPFVWRNDPAYFPNVDEFFLAHELAHQWWGQAVGWENYHEQWLSEGFAQYFAALYAEHSRGPRAFRDILRQFSRWTESTSAQGPIYLGYRLGHLKSDSRVFRALVYNKGALVLHMLRELVGEDAFFAALRRFYRENRFQKAGTSDLRAALEQEAGFSLETFFERWVFGQDLPSAEVRWSVEEEVLTLIVEQEEPVFPFPLPVQLQYRDGNREAHVVPVREAHVVWRQPLTSPLRRVELNEDERLPLDLD